MRHLFVIALLLVSACSPQRQTYHDKPSPDRAKFVADLFYQPDDAPLPYRQWEPAKGPYKKHPKAVIVALHGFNDYSRAFIGTGTYMAEHGIVMYAYDQRGFGSSPYTGIWAGEDNLVHDLSNFVRRVKDRHPGVPIYVLGESMGGAVAIIAASSPDFPRVNGIILEAPAIWGEETMNPLYRSTLWLAAHTLPTYQLTGSDLKIMASNNIPMLRRMARDPLVIKSTRVDTIYGIVKLMDNAYRNVPNVKQPVLLVYGSDDQVIPFDPIRRALARFTAPVRFAYYPGSYHMMLRDIQGEVIQADIASWIEHPKAPMPSGIEVKDSNIASVPQK